jgi:hypothetical protein
MLMQSCGAPQFNAGQLYGRLKYQTDRNDGLCHRRTEDFSDDGCRVAKWCDL